MANLQTWFSHDSNARNSDKLLNVRMKLGAEGYGAFFMIIERLREEPEYRSLRDYDMIAFDLRVPTDLVRSIIEDFDLFVIDDEHFYSESLLKRMEIKDEKMSKKSNAGNAGAINRWGKSDEVAKKKRSERLTEARKKGTHTKDEWNELKEYFGECVICGSKENIVKDHIIPLYQGGSDSISNLQPLCKSCNSKKGPDNNDYRIDFCNKNGIEMPSKWLANVWQMSGDDCISKDKISKDKISKDINNNTANADASADLKSEIQGRIWAEYPHKKGKFHAMKAIEKLLKGYTERQIINAIVAYKSDVEEQRASGFKELKYKQGDTFFRTGIHDYLDQGGSDSGYKRDVEASREVKSTSENKYAGYDWTKFNKFK